MSIEPKKSDWRRYRSAFCFCLLSSGRACGTRCATRRTCGPSRLAFDAGLAKSGEELGSKDEKDEIGRYDDPHIVGNNVEQNKCLPIVVRNVARAIANLHKSVPKGRNK